LLQIGVDFGGTKIEAAALDAHGRLLARRRAPTPADYSQALQRVRELVLQVEQEVGGSGSVGVGGPGSVDPLTGVLRNSSTVWLNGRAFREDLQAVLERPVRLANDANCLALSEGADGAARGARSVFAIILGTGCGAGVMLDGKLVEGANGIAGEWGHITLPWQHDDEFPGPHCWCGRFGCIETWVSGSGLAADHRRRTGVASSGEQILAAARQGDAAARATMDRHQGRLGRALAMIVNLFDPEVFVFGGGLSNIEELYARLPAAIEPYVFGRHACLRLLPALWGDSSGVRGAARLWP
jgi:fructokinase